MFNMVRRCFLLSVIFAGWLNTVSAQSIAARQVVLQRTVDASGKYRASFVCSEQAVRQIETERAQHSCGACVGTTFECSLEVSKYEGGSWSRLSAATDVWHSYENSVSLSFDGTLLKVRVDFGGHYSSYSELRKYRLERGGHRLRLVGREIRSAWSDGFVERSDQLSENWLTRHSKSRSCESEKSSRSCTRWQRDKIGMPGFRIYLKDGWGWPEEDPAPLINPSTPPP